MLARAKFRGRFGRVNFSKCTISQISVPLGETHFGDSSRHCVAIQTYHPGPGPLHSRFRCEGGIFNGISQSFSQAESRRDRLAKHTRSYTHTQRARVCAYLTCLSLASYVGVGVCVCTCVCVHVCVVRGRAALARPPTFASLRKKRVRVFG